MTVILVKSNSKITFKNVKDVICYVLYSHIYTIAVYLAIVELFRKPFNWNKTMHNRSLYN